MLLQSYLYSCKVGKHLILILCDLFYWLLTDLLLILMLNRYHKTILFILFSLFRHVGNGCNNGWTVHTPSSFSWCQVCIFSLSLVSNFSHWCALCCIMVCHCVYQERTIVSWLGNLHIWGALAWDTGTECEFLFN